MAFGIDDALLVAASSISLTDTIVKTIKSYQKSGQDIDLEHLIQEVHGEVLKNIYKADNALNQFESLLKDSGVNMGKTLEASIAETPFWRPWQQHKLKQIRNSFRSFGDSLYNATDDVAALVRCQKNTQPMGEAVVEASPQSASCKRIFRMPPP